MDKLSKILDNANRFDQDEQDELLYEHEKHMLCIMRNSLNYNFIPHIEDGFA